LARFPSNPLLLRLGLLAVHFLLEQVADRAGGLLLLGAKVGITLKT